MMRTSALHKRLNCLGLALVVLLPGVALANDTHGIVGGDVVTDTSRFEYKHTARLLVTARTEGNDVPESLRGLRLSWRCSAVIVDKTILLSAAHCFPKTIGLKDSATDRVYRVGLGELKAEAFFKTDPRSDRMSGTVAQKIVVHEGFRDDWSSRVSDVWNPSEPIHDLAVLKLREAIPSDKAPVGLLMPSDQPLLEDETLTMAGYGRDLGEEQISLPRLRSVRVPLREDLRNQTEWFAGFGNTTRAGRAERPAGGCMGDSGGPVYAQRGDTVRVVGIIVRGPDETNGGCAASVTISTSLPAYKDWLAQQFKALK